VVSPKTAFWKWSIVAAFAGTVLVAAQVVEVGGIGGLIQAGEANELTPLIRAELGEVSLAENAGHDGQLFYAIGLDLNGDEIGESFDHGLYRYRRILYSFVSSAGGLFDGYRLLYGMLVVAGLSFMVAAGTTAAIAARHGRSDYLALAVVLNPGLWLSLRLLTSDVMALALTVVALYAIDLGWRYASVLFAASGLAKDVYIVTPAALMVRKETRNWSLVVVPALALIAWTTYLTTTINGGFTETGNITFPFLGIVTAGSTWAASTAGDIFYLAFALASVVAGLVYTIRRESWLRWPILAWSALGVMSSSWVWDFGNNAARAFAPIVVLIAIAEGSRVQPSRSGLASDDQPAQPANRQQGVDKP